MSRVRGSDTRPELALRRALWREGLRYRLRLDLPGSPDLAFPNRRLALFVDGCFWHGCPLHYSAPTTRAEFWAVKLRDNVLRDQRVDALLADLSWSPLRAWQHELKEMDVIVQKVRSVVERAETEDRYSSSRQPVVAEMGVPYGPWYACPCGSCDVRVLAVSGPGSLRLRARKRPEQVELLCWLCGERFHRKPATG